MASRKPQVTVRLTDEWLDKLPDLARRTAAALGQPEVSLPDLMMMSLAMFEEWIGQREAARAAEIAGLAEPVPVGLAPKVGRPRKQPPPPAEPPAEKRRRGLPRKASG